MHRSLIALGLLAGACNIPDEVITGEGRVCLHGLGTAQIVIEGQPSPIEVTSPCVSACAENVDADCSVNVDGRDISIASRFAFDVPGDACIALCGALEARCELPALAAGSYTVRHGDDLSTLEVGSAGPHCFGE